MFQFVFPQSFTKIAPFFFAPSAVWSNDNLSLVPWLVNGPWPMEGFRTFSLYWVVLNFTKICLDVRFSFFSYEPFLSFWETHLRYFLKYSLLSDFADLSFLDSGYLDIGILILTSFSLSLIFSSYPFLLPSGTFNSLIYSSSVSILLFYPTMSLCFLEYLFYSFQLQ